MRNLTRVLFAGAIISCGGVRAADVMADFETPEGLPAQRTHDANWRVCVTNLFAASGRRAVYWGGAWKKGLYEYPAVTIPVPEGLRDWRGYDRLSIDVVSTGEKSDKVFVRLPGSDNWGVTKTFYAPANTATRFILPLGDWPKSVDPAQIRQVEIFAERPEGVGLFLDRFTLLKAGEALPPAPVFDARSTEVLKGWRRETEARIAARRRTLVERLRSGMSRAGIESKALAVGQASSMSRVMPRGGFEDRPEVGGVDGLGVRLAKGEREGVQLVVTPLEGDLHDVRVTASDLKDAKGNLLPAASIACEPVGYVKITEPGRYAVGMAHRRPLPGWYPDPILSFLDRVDVRGHEVQSFWIRVTCPENQTAGTYAGHLVVASSGNAEVRIPFTVRVNDFVLPRTPPLPLAISFNPEPWTDWNRLSSSDKEARERLWKDPEAPVNAWKRHRLEWGSFLADYYITFTSLYNGNFSAVQWDVLRKLKEEGRLGLFNIGYWHPLYDRWLKDDGATWRANTLQRLRDNYAKAKELGLLDHVYAYGCDEAPTNLFPAISRALGRLRKEFPDLTIGTTTYDFSFGEDSPLGGVSFFTPTIEKFTPEMAQKARASGRKVWWYFACDEKAPWPNMFIEGLPIEGRLLTGAMAQRMKPDGLLYYQIAIWNAARPITSGPYTDWVAQAWCGDNGDGMWTAVGPDGIPLSTIRLENFRDGLDDLAYARLLEAKLRARGERSDAWTIAAKAALAVPETVMKAMTEYTNDPENVRRWRDRMADLIQDDNAVATPVVNPLPGGPAPDPCVVYDNVTGYYYALYTGAGNDGFSSSTLSISRSRQAATLREGETKLLYVTNAADRVYDFIWAPEMHKAPDGRWYIWTSGAYDPERQHKRIIVFQSKTSDPFDGFVFKGHPDPDMDAIDPTVTTFPDGRMYACISPYDFKTMRQWLQIRELRNPWSYGAKRADVAFADQAWERVPPYDKDWTIVEGPFFLRSPDGKRLFIVYSANGCWSDDYALGVLEYQGGEPCRKEAWRKHPTPVFKKGNGVFGTGHASFFKSPDGTETWVAYHSLERSDPEGKPMPRYMNLQKISFDGSGFPVFGDPVPHGRPMPPPSGESASGVWSVGEVNGAPGLLHDGEPVEPSFFWQWYGEKTDVAAFAKGGTRLFSQFVDIPATRAHWTADGTPDLAFYRTNLDHFVEWAPNGFLLPRVFYTPPKWWLDAHPEERVAYAVKTNTGAYVSYASETFLREGAAAYAKTVKALERRYGDRLMGVHAACGPWGEHFGWDAFEECNLGFRLRPGSDVSEPMRRRFSDYLRRKYGNDVARLRRAFRDGAVTFESVHVPTAEERRRLNGDGWRDPAAGRLVPDYFECHHETTVRMIENFCRAAKEATGGRKLTCVFYGYTQDEPWGVECDHRAVSKLLASPWVDMISAPHTYNRREPGGDASMRQYLASAALHGKLFVDESDDRTYLQRRKPRTGEPYPGYFPTNLEETVHTLFREFGNAVTHGVGQWYMDIDKDNFRDPAIVEACTRARGYMCEAMKRPRGHHSEVAVISNPESEFYLGYRMTGENFIGVGLYEHQLPAFYRTGAPFDWYLIDDLEAVANGPARVIVFLDCEFMTDRHRELVERLKSKGRTLVFLHAPGYVCEDRLSQEAMEKVIGFKVKGIGRAPLLSKNPVTREEYGWASAQKGLFAPVIADGVKPLANGVDALKEVPLIATKDFGTWKSCFAGVPGLSPNLLRELFREAGVHVYETSGAVLSANESWVMVHTRKAGRYTVRLPKRCRRVTEVVTGRVVGENVSEVTLDLGAKRTAVLMLDVAEETAPRVSVFACSIRAIAKQRGISKTEAAELLYGLGVRGFDIGSDEADIEELAATMLKPINVYFFPTWFGKDAGRHGEDACLSLVRRHGVPRIMVVPPNFSGKGKEEDEFSVIMERMKSFVERAVEQGTVVTIEDFGGGYNCCNYLRYMRLLLEGIPKLRVALDSGNFLYAGKGDSILDLMNGFRDRIEHVHLKDQSPEDNRSFVSLGLGAVPNERIVRTMNDSGYAGWYTLENPVGDVLQDVERQLSVLQGWFR